MERHLVLTVVSVLMKLLAWIALVGGVVGAVMAIAFGSLLTSMGAGRSNIAGPLGSVGLALISLLVGVIYFLTFYAYGDVIAVLLKILENTQRILQGRQNPEA
jgi:hypothetical protein